MVTKTVWQVPVEIEILCLLGAMQAYKMANNIPASEACRAEVENIVIACKKSPRDMNQIYFIAQLCDEYGFKTWLEICYFAVLISKTLHPNSLCKRLLYVLAISIRRLNGMFESCL